MPEVRVRRRRDRIRATTLLGVALTAFALATAAYALDAFEQQELDTVDARFAIRGERAPRGDVALVLVDAATFDDLERQWPFPRGLHGALIDRLREAGAGAIGYDVQFTEESRPEEDNRLIEAVERAGNVVLATSEVDAQGNSGVLGGDETVRAHRGRVGNVNFELDADGVHRRLHYSLEGLKGFAVTLAETFTGRPVDPFRFQDGSALIDYAGPPGTFATYSFADVLAGRVPPSRLRRKAVIVGAGAPILQDVHPTAISASNPMAGAEIQANALATVLAGLPLRDTAALVDIALIALLALVATLPGLRLAPIRTPLLALGAGAGYLVVSQLLFGAGVVTSVVYPMLAVTVGGVGSLGVDYLTAAHERQRIRELFSRFVPESVVDEVIAGAGDDLRLGAVERECTLMFCDLRGFTTFSEGCSARRVIEVVNVYFEEMSAAILGAGGTLLQYQGDGIVAIFGAPLEQPDHADRALAAAREMRDVRLTRFNAWLYSEGIRDGFRMGIGLNTGVVVAGNVGAAHRVTYTVVGDTANTASRVEGLTKQTGHMIHLTQSTREALCDAPGDLEFAGEHQIRGRSAPLGIWTVAGESGAEPPPTAAQID